MTPQALRKAAIVVATLDSAAADQLLEQMPPAQAALVRRMVMDLGDVDEDEERDVLAEFFRVRPTALEKNGVELDIRLAERLTYSQPSPGAAKAAVPFEFLEHATIAQLTPFLTAEHPQTVAMVISHLAPRRAAEVLSALPAALQGSVLRRLASLQVTEPGIVRDVEQGLQARLSASLSENAERTAGLAAVSRVLDAADADLREQLSASLLAHDRGLAQQVGVQPALAPELPQGFSFEELGELTDAELALVFETAPPRTMLLALAGAAPAFAERVVACLPRSAGRALKKQLRRNLGPTPLRDIEAAQQQMAQRADELLGESQHTQTWAA